MKITAIIAAGGRSVRFGSDKLMLELGGQTVLERSIRAFEQGPSVTDIIVVTAESRVSYVRSLGFSKLRAVVPGGETRAESVRRGLAAAAGSDYIMIHDGARPLLSQTVISDVVEAALRGGAAAPFVALKDSVKLIRGGQVAATIDRDSALAVQTPQMFAAAPFTAAFERADGTEKDDCEVAEKAGIAIAVVPGDYNNMKITTKEDAAAACSLLGASAMRIGHGYDVHRLAHGEELVLCGVRIPYELGLVGHSDADVAAHAAADAILGAAALRDIGYHFPDTDSAYKGADSLKLLARCVELAGEKGLRVGNLDVTIIAQAPKLSPYIEAMRRSLAAAVGVDADCVSVKATTEEHLGFTGRQEGIAAHAVVLLVYDQALKGSEI